MSLRGRGARNLRQSKACYRKVAYATRKEAEEHLHDLMRRASHHALNVYECTVCKQFHIGNTPTWRRPDH